MPIKSILRAARASTGIAFLTLACSVASSQTPASSEAIALKPIGFDRSGFIGVHDTVADPTVHSYTGMVVALGSPSPQGEILSFRLAPTGPNNFPLSPGDLRGWRLTVLTGKCFGHVFTVSTNTESEITVTADKGALDGLGMRDLFIIESVDADGASMFAPTGGAGTAAPSSM